MNDDSRKRKATQAPNTPSKKPKTNTATTSRVAPDTPTRPATRSISKNQAASTAKVDSTHYRDPSPGACQSTADTHRTRSKTGFLKSKKGLSENRTPSSTSGLSQWVADTQHQKLRCTASSQSSPKPSHTKKRSKAPPPKPEDIIVISSDDDGNPRPQKRLRRRHTTQVNEIIDLTKDEISPSPRSRPTRLRPARLPTPTTLASLRTSPSSSSRPKHIDLRRLSSKAKPKTTPPPSRSHSQTQTSSRPLKTKLPAASSPTKMRRQDLNDNLDDKERYSFSACKLPAVEVVINKCNASPAAVPRTRLNSNLTPQTEPEPGFGRLMLSKELRARLQDEEEEEESVPSPLLLLNTTDGITNAVSGQGNMDANLTDFVIKTEDIEDTYIDHQSSILNLAEEEDLVVVKEEPQFDEPSSIADQLSPPIDDQEQDDMEEAIFQSMLVASVNETGLPLADQEGGVEEQDGYLAVPTVSPSALMPNTSTVTDPARRETPVVFEEVKEKEEEANHEDVVELKDSEAEKMPDEIVPKRPLCASTDTPAPTLNIHPYLDYELEQEQADLEEALSQSQLAIVYSPPVSTWEDEEKSGMEEQERDLNRQIDVTAPPALDPTGNLNPSEDVSVSGDPDDTALTTNETLTLPVSVTTSGTGDKIIPQAPSNGIIKTKDDEAVASLVSAEFSVPLHQVDAPCPFACSVPTATFARFVPTESTSNVFVTGQLTQRFFAHSCLPPKARTEAIKRVEERELVMEVQMADPIVDLPAEERQNEKTLTEMLLQSEVEQVQSVVQSEHEESVGEVQVEEPVEEVPVWNETDEMLMPVVLDVDDIAMNEAEMTVEQEADIDCEEGNGDGDKGAVCVPSSGYNDDNAGIAVSQGLDSEVLSCHALKTSGDEDIGAGVAREIQDVLMIPAAAIHDGTVLLQASEDEVVSAVSQEDEVTHVETTSVSSPQTTEDIDMVKLTLQPKFEPPSALEKDPILSRALRSSRVLLEIIQSVINKAESESEVGPEQQFEKADGGIVYSPCFRASTEASEAPPLLGDRDAPFLSDDEPQSSPNSISESLVQFEDIDDDTSRLSADVSPSSLQVAEELTLEPLAEVKGSGDAPEYHVVLASSRAQTSKPEPCTHGIEDVMFASSGTLEAIQSPRPHAQSEGESLARNCPLEVSSSPGLETSPLEPLTLEDEIGEDSVTAGPLEHASEDELPRSLTSIHNFPFQSHHHLTVEDGGQFCHQSIVSTDDIPSTTAPQRRTMSNAGSESSLATSDDSPPPHTPPRSAFEAYYIRSTSPDDGLGLDIFSKLTYIPSFPQPQSDEEDDEYLLSLDLSYPDFDIAG